MLRSALSKQSIAQSIATPVTLYLLGVARGSNIFLQILVTILSYISNACHCLLGVAERLQHT